MVAAPVISGLSPTHGKVGTSVAITGYGFTGASAVRFNGAAAVFTVLRHGDHRHRARRCQHRQNRRGRPRRSLQEPLPLLRVPTISSFWPTSGTVGTSVAITGTGFTHATKVLFAGIAATYTVASPNKINVTVPPGATTGKITIRTAGGSATSTTNFTILKSARTTKPHR